MTGQSHTDIPITVTTGGDALEQHTAAIDRLDDLLEVLERLICGHKVLSISPHMRTVQLEAIADLARAFDGSGLAMHLQTCGNYRHASCVSDGWEFTACDKIEAEERETVRL